MSDAPTPVPREKRALAGLRGGPITRAGDPRLASLCAAALDVVPNDDPLPFTHGFHSYPARFHPELPRRLLEALPDARRVLDPFVGSGTTLIESVVAGRDALGTDVNQLAVTLSRLKSTPASEARRATLAATATAIAERAIAEGKAARRATAPRPSRGPAPQFDDPSFYAPHVYRELVTLRLAIDEAAPAVESARGDSDPRWLRDALLLVLSSIVVKVSLQRSDSDSRRIERQVGRGAAARLFAARATQLRDQLAAYADAVPAGTPPPDVRRADARRLRHIEDASIDLVITSPPYLGTYDYSAHHERRFGWIGLDDRARQVLHKGEIGARRTTTDADDSLARWRADVDAYTREIARALAPDGLAFLLVGDSFVAGRPIAGDAEPRRAAAEHSLVVVASASQGRFDTAGRGEERERKEHLLALRRA